MYIVNNIYHKNILINLVVIFIFFVLSLVQIFPDGYFFASGDSAQIVSFKTWIINNYSLWSDNHLVSGGLGIHNNQYQEIPYHYFIYFISSLLNLQIEGQSVIHHFLFYIFSFYSMNFYLKNSLDYLSKIERVTASFIYVFNIIVFYIFFYTWGYTTFYFLYITIPLFFAYFDIICKFKTIKETLIFCLKIVPILILFNISFRNPAFLISILFFINLYVLYNFVADFKNYKLNLLKIVIFNFILIATLLPSLLNLILYLNENLQGTRDQIWDQLSWVKGQAASFPKPFYLFEGYELIKKNFFVNLQYLYFGLLILLILFDGLKTDISKISKLDIKKYFFLFSLTLFIFFHNKGIDFLNDFQIYTFFVNSIYYIFRSSDKVIIYYPFITLVLIIILLKNNFKRLNILTCILLFNIIISFPLILGKIKVKYDLAVADKQDFTLSEYAMIKKYSKDYSSIIKILENDLDFDRYGVINVPFTGFTSPNWSNYQKNQHVGYDPYFQFFKHKTFSFNNWSTKEMNFIGRTWNQAKPNDVWYKNIFKLFPNKYLIFHKDTHDFIYEESIDKISILEKEEIILKIYEGEQLNFYEINSNFSNEIIFLPEFKIETDFSSYKDFYKFLNKVKNIIDSKYIIKFGNIDYKNYNEFINNKKFNSWLSTNKENFKNENNIENYSIKDVNIKYEKISSTKYKIKLSNLKNQKLIVGFLQAFSHYWKLDEKNQGYELINHFKCNGYANCYEINPLQENLELTLEYIPQKLINKILIFELILIILSLGAIIISKRKNEN